MKNILVVLFGMAIAGQALADVDVAAGVKLYGVLDQAVQPPVKNMSACTLRYQPAVWASELSVISVAAPKRIFKSK